MKHFLNARSLAAIKETNDQVHQHLAALRRDRALAKMMQPVDTRSVPDFRISEFPLIGRPATPPKPLAGRMIERRSMVDALHYAERRQSQRRFSGEPITAMGALS